MQRRVALLVLEPQIGTTLDEHLYYSWVALFHGEKQRCVARDTRGERIGPSLQQFLYHVWVLRGTVHCVKESVALPAILKVHDCSVVKQALDNLEIALLTGEHEGGAALLALFCVDQCVGSD